MAATMAEDTPVEETEVKLNRKQRRAAKAVNQTPEETERKLNIARILGALGGGIVGIGILGGAIWLGWIIAGAITGLLGLGGLGWTLLAYFLVGGPFVTAPLCAAMVRIIRLIFG